MNNIDVSNLNEDQLDELLYLIAERKENLSILREANSVLVPENGVSHERKFLMNFNSIRKSREYIFNRISQKYGKRFAIKFMKKLRDHDFYAMFSVMSNTFGDLIINCRYFFGNGIRT